MTDVKTPKKLALAARRAAVAPAGELVREETPGRAGLPLSSLPAVARRGRLSPGPRPTARRSSRSCCATARSSSAASASRGTEGLQAFVRAVCGDLLEYRERSSPRSEVADRVYTSTDYPAEQPIFPHNEHSYARRFPLKLFFFCVTPRRDRRRDADRRHRGGSSQRIDPEIRRALRGAGLDVRAQLPRRASASPGRRSSRPTTGREVEALLPRGRHRLRVARRRPPAHPAGAAGDRRAPAHRRDGLVQPRHLLPRLDAAARPSASRCCATSARRTCRTTPSTATARPSSRRSLEHLRAGLHARRWSRFPWQEGDVLLIDNMLTAHARNPFTGPRKVVVAMADPHTRDDV